MLRSPRCLSRQDVEGSDVTKSSASQRRVVGNKQPSTRLEQVGPDAGGHYYDIKVCADSTRDWGGTCGSNLWAASLALIKWLCAEDPRLALIKGSRVLEIGSGLGFAGCALAALGAKCVLCTDLPTQQRLLQYNIEANKMSAVSCTTFVWGTRPKHVFSKGPWDLAIGCDILYAEEHVDDLARSIADLLTRCSAQVLLVLPDRTDFGLTCSPTDPEPLPDYECLLAAVEHMLPERLVVDRIGSVPPGLSGTVSSHIDLMLLSVADDSLGQCGKRKHASSP